MESQPNVQNNVKNIARSILAGIGITIGIFLFGTLLIGAIGMFLVSMSSCWESCPLAVIAISPFLGGLIAVVAGINGAWKQYQTLLRNDIRNHIKNNIKIDPLELQSIASERKSSPAEIQEEEMSKWKAGFIKIGWMEEIGKNTETALKKSPEEHRTFQESLLCVTYADVKGSHITGAWFNQVDLYSPFTAFIATSNRIILVHPEEKIVQVIEYKNIREVEIISHAHSKTYTISTLSGDTVKIDANFSGKDDEIIVDAFFERTTSAR